MTEQQAKEKLVAWALAQVGYQEGANNYNKYAEEWTQAGGWNAQCQPWCDVFVDVMFIECFGLQAASKMTYQPVGSFSALCSASAQYYKNNNAWFTSPAVGDQVFFYSGGGINHTGIVVSLSGGLVYTVEGNSSDAVRRNSYAVGNSYIAGYGRPKWSVVVNSDEDPQPTPTPEPTPAPITGDKVTVTMPMLQYGATGNYVKLMQRLLIDFHGCSCGIWGADGDFGTGTKQAVMKFQKQAGIEIDGVCGPDSWGKLLEV